MWRKIWLHQLRSPVFLFQTVGLLSQAETVPPTVQFHYSICIAVLPCTDGMQLLSLPVNVEEVSLVLIHLPSFMSYWFEFNDHRRRLRWHASPDLPLCSEEGSSYIDEQVPGGAAQRWEVTVKAQTQLVCNPSCVREQKLSCVTHFLHLIKIFLSFM